jgi:triacylglycerol lipase
MAKPLRSPRSDDRAMNGAAVGPAGEGREHVVLVHGLLRTPRSWITVRRHLEREGFSTGVFGYPSLRGGLEPHGRALAAELRRLDARGRDARGRWARVHLVGHSLGNLVIRAALAHVRPKNLGRVVMLVPPNRGSPVARRLARLLGDLFPVLRDLSDADGSAARRLAFPPMEAGVIAARFDHVVAESSTHCPGEADHLLVGASHGWLMYRPSVQRAIVAFLRTGQFPRRPPSPQKSRRREERSSR